MPMLGIAKERLADQLGSAATKGEGCCVSSPLDGAGFAEERCEEGCCGPMDEIPSTTPASMRSPTR